MTISTPDRLHCLEEEPWAHIKDSFPRAKGNKGFQPEIFNREVLEAVIYRSRTGCPWRDLPKEYGYWHAIYMRWTRWHEIQSCRQSHVLPPAPRTTRTA